VIRRAVAGALSHTRYLRASLQLLQLQCTDNTHSLYPPILHVSYYLFAVISNKPA